MRKIATFAGSFRNSFTFCQLSLGVGTANIEGNMHEFSAEMANCDQFLLAYKAARTFYVVVPSGNNGWESACFWLSPNVLN